MLFADDDAGNNAAGCTMASACVWRKRQAVCSGTDSLSRVGTLSSRVAKDTVSSPAREPWELASDVGWRGEVWKGPKRKANLTETPGFDRLRAVRANQRPRRRHDPNKPGLGGVLKDAASLNITCSCKSNNSSGISQFVGHLFLHSISLFQEGCWSIGTSFKIHTVGLGTLQ